MRNNNVIREVNIELVASKMFRGNLGKNRCHNGSCHSYNLNFIRN